MQTKRCKKCKRELPAEAFYKSRITDDGLYWYCKECERKRSEQRRREAGSKKRTKKPPKLTLRAQIETMKQALGIAKDALRLAEAGQLDGETDKQVQVVITKTLAEVERSA